MKENCIEWIFDTEDKLDEDDPLGEVRIYGEQGSFVREDCTNIDVFLEALVKGIPQTIESYELSIDPFVEPDDMIFKYADGILEISYGSQTIIVNDLMQLKQSLFDAVQKLVVQIDSLTIQKNREKRKLRYLRQYLQKSRPTS